MATKLGLLSYRNEAMEAIGTATALGITQDFAGKKNVNVLPRDTID